jgi:hypothetical protein
MGRVGGSVSQEPADQGRTREVILDFLVWVELLWYVLATATVVVFKGDLRSLGRRLR